MMLHARLPQMERLFLADAGIETDMIFNRGFDLPYFASIVMLQSDEGRAALDRYFRDFLELASKHGTGVILETATWRASSDWAAQLGLTLADLDRLNGEAVAMLIELKGDYPGVEVVASGCIGPRGDGYDPGKIMSWPEAAAYHKRQAAALAAAGPDMLSAMTMTNINEAIGIVRAAEGSEMPIAVSFTVETDGRLPTGDTLAEAIAAVDTVTDAYPSYYMINCAHPTHFAQTLEAGEEWTTRVRGIRANASRCSHAELEAMTGIDDGNPSELAAEYRELRRLFPNLTVLGGCCGTDIRHVSAIADACIPTAVAA